MKRLYCVTSNASKFGIAKALLAKHDIELEQVAADIDEIQGENLETIIRDKAQKAYQAIGKPVIVTDDSWTIPGLGGFPGPYMKSISQWFTPDDFIRLTRDLADRRIFLNQLAVYQDELETVVFRSDIPGTICLEASGDFGPPIMKVVTLEGDNGLTISQTYDQGIEHDSKRLDLRSGAWQQLAKWYNQKVTV